MSDNFWKALVDGHTTSPKMSSVDAHISGKAHGADFERVRALTDRERARMALDLSTPEGTKVSFTGSLGGVLTYDDPPADGLGGVIVTAKSANGEITHHDGKFFVQWEDGKFRPVYAEHLRRASEQEAEKLEAEAEAANAQAEADRQKADAARMKEGASDQVMAYRAGRGAKKTKEYGRDMDSAAREYVARRENPDSEEGKAMEVAFILGWMGKPMPRSANDIRCASLGDLTEFLKVAEGKLIHKSTKDLWSFQKDADGMFVVTRLFDDSGEPLRGV